MIGLKRRDMNYIMKVGAKAHKGGLPYETLYVQFSIFKPNLTAYYLQLNTLYQ